MFSLIPRRGRRAERALIPREPFEAFRREFANLFERAFPILPMPFETWEMPEGWGLTTEERENEMVVRAELPGFELAELEVTVTGNVLTIRAAHPERPEAKEEERVRESIERTMTLPEGLELANVAATYRNGVLEIHFPRVPAAKPHRVEVKT